MYLVSATPGTGKSCWVVKQITQWIEDPTNQGRKIYSNIAGLKIQGVEVPPDDFRECPDGSIIVYDEAQEIEHYSSDSRANNPIAKALSKHRHRGFDIWFITQDPSLLHKYVLKNIYLHYYLWRPAQRQMIEIYTFARAIVTPTKDDFKNAYDKVWWRFDEYYLQFYKSTVVNTSKKVGSSKRAGAIFTGIIFALMIGAAIYPAIKHGAGISQAPKQQVKAAVPASPVASAPAVTVSNPMQLPASTPMLLQQSQTQTQIIKRGFYNPLHGNYIDNLDLVPVSVISFGDKCTAYNINNQVVNIPASDCKAYLAHKGLLPVVTREPSYDPTMTTQPSPAQHQPNPVIDAQEIAKATDQLNPVNLQKFNHDPQKVVPHG